ncbi:3-methylornithine--L-lysine ligase PylC [Desulfospira joergensenii]|uniref:3-methylornithine--L-lysine ligase PylC n=1 Tax=Desulfospira joergensenii TaxID=53329 RepID=UPI0003B65AC5|nr:3-methylornithine--L-lysine ligase PylC [Desulfospira joergensenii]
MRIAVVGGKLQGVEAVYLAKKAGWETLVLDRNIKAPATGLCDRFMEFEFSPEHPVPRDCPRVDLILPAFENERALGALETWSRIKKIPLAFDMAAFRLSSSKLASDLLFKKMNLPAPLPWPDCPFPVVVKPDQDSGSRGVEVLRDPKEYSRWLSSHPEQEGRVIQEYMDGPSFSLEVLGCPGSYRALQVTDLSMDKVYDCKRVTAPTRLLPHQIKKFEKMALALAAEIKLTGIMDVEVILSRDELKLLEIDARLPSQTPMTVFGSTGINMVELLGRLFLGGEPARPGQNKERFALVEHVRVSRAHLEVAGEHIMSRQGPLRLETGFFGCDEAITSYKPGDPEWVATLIFSGRSREEVEARQQDCHGRIREHQKV